MKGRIKTWILKNHFGILKQTQPQAKNGNRKILADCTVIVNDKQVQLITRDDGVIFDITGVNEKIKSLRSYVAARLMETNSGTTYLTTTSFNRNSYVWER